MTTPAPSKANAAPKPSVTTVGTGLISALNNYQQQLFDLKLIEVADQYSIEFADSIIADASIVPPTGLDKALAVGAKGGTAAQQLLPNRQSMDPGSRARAASVGQQIVQFIDQVIRSSTYIQEQAVQTWDQSTGSWTTPKTKPAQQFAWFQVICNVQPLAYDNLRNDFAYKMNYLIVPFETPMLSTYFPSGKSRGVHKFYPYWFTGENNSILSFEQSYNAQWTQALTGTQPPDNRVIRINDYPDYVQRWRTNVYPASSQSNQGGDKLTMEPGANAADFLYSADLMTATVNIVGDPAWLPGAREVTKDTFSSDPFLSDGTINSVASDAYFAVSFNTPSDYNLSTGLIDPRVSDIGANGSTTVYRAVESTSVFKAGKFTQELKGTWVTHTDPIKNNVTTREPVVKPSAQSRQQQQTEQQLQTQKRAVDSQQSSLAKGVQQILNPVDASPNASDVELSGSPAYIEARKAGRTPEQALALARAASAAGTNNFQGTALPGIRTGPQKIVKDGNPG